MIPTDTPQAPGRGPRRGARRTSCPRPRSSASSTAISSAAFAIRWPLTAGEHRPSPRRRRRRRPRRGEGPGSGASRLARRRRTRRSRAARPSRRTRPSPRRRRDRRGRAGCVALGLRSRTTSGTARRAAARCAAAPRPRASLLPRHWASLWSSLVMDFELSEEQEAFRKVVREFAESRDRAARRDLGSRPISSPSTPSRAMGDLGLFGLIFPPEYGGSGADFTTLCVALEEIGARRPVDGDHAGGGRRPRREPDLPVRHRGAATARGCPTCAPGERSAASA